MVDEKNDEVLSDELPSAPQASQAGQQPEIDGTIDSSLFEGVPKLGEAMPVGTYHMRADRYTENWQKPDPNDPEALLFGDQPQFNVFWVCQEEPHTGQRFMDWVEWVNKETIQAAKNGNKSAAKLVRTRLARAKAILQAAEYPLTSTFDFKHFLSDHPEIKIQLGVRERKQKVNGELKGTGEMANFGIRYVSLRQPR